MPPSPRRERRSKRRPVVRSSRFDRLIRMLACARSGVVQACRLGRPRPSRPIDSRHGERRCGGTPPVSRQKSLGSQLHLEREGSSRAIWCVLFPAAGSRFAGGEGTSVGKLAQPFAQRFALGQCQKPITVTCVNGKSRREGDSVGVAARTVPGDVSLEDGIVTGKSACHKDAHELNASAYGFGEHHPLPWDVESPVAFRLQGHCIFFNAPPGKDGIRSVVRRLIRTCLNPDGRVGLIGRPVSPFHLGDDVFNVPTEFAAVSTAGYESGCHRARPGLPSGRMRTAIMPMTVPPMHKIKSNHMPPVPTCLRQQP